MSSTTTATATARRTLALAWIAFFGCGQAGFAEAGINPEIPESLEPAIAAVGTGDHEGAIAYLEKEAAGGNLDAAFALGEMHLAGLGMEASVPKALEWYGRGADAGHARSQFRLGELYCEGRPGLERDKDRGLFLIQSAADSGLGAAWLFLGRRSLEAARVANETPDRERLFAEARLRFGKAAEAGDPEGAHEYAQLLYEGRGGTKDPSRAFAWLRKSAEGGLAEAMNEIGRRIQAGDGTEANLIEALGWFLAGAERDDPAAITNLGICYENGIGVPVNFDRAGSWYARAAKQNYPQAQLLLGRLFEHGRGTPPNPVFAYLNYANAAKGGLADAVAARDALKDSLTPEQLAEAERQLARSSDPSSDPSR